MREAVYTSNIFRMRAAPHALKTSSKLRVTLGYIFLLLLFWGALGAMVPWCHNGAMRPYSRKGSARASPQGLRALCVHGRKGSARMGSRVQRIH